MKESTVGKILLLAMPLVMMIPSMAVVATLPSWMSVLGLATFVLAEVGAVCFFFPDQTINRLTRWRAHRHAIRTGIRLGAHDVTRLLARHPDPCDHGLPRLVTIRAFENPNYGRVAVQWIRRRGDLTLLADALTIPLAPHLFTAHLDGSQPLDKEAIATLAALSDPPDLPIGLDLFIGSPTGSGSADTDAFLAVAPLMTRTRSGHSYACQCTTLTRS